MERPVSIILTKRSQLCESEAKRIRRGIANTAFFCLLLAAAETFAIEHLHTVAPAYHTTIIGSESASTYNFHSPGISYGVALGQKICFRGRLTAFFPIHLFQDGHYFHARDFYSPSFGGEVLLGAAYAFHLADDQLIIADLGAHLNTIKMGSSTFESFYSFTLGAGAGLEYLYPLNRVWLVGSFISIAGHFLDLAHEVNGLRYGIFICAGITLGWQFRRNRTAAS